MKLLLHTCCAPCLIYPYEHLKEKHFNVVALFYNPNVHPLPEYNARKKAVEDYAKKNNIEVLFADYNPAEFFRAINMLEEKDERCPMCWQLRLKVTAQLARDRGFNYFSTTLLVSPYQDQELLNKIGFEVAADEDIEFYYEDFRSGFRSAHDKAKLEGIYCQKYCGCIYSEIERYKKK